MKNLKGGLVRQQWRRRSVDEEYSREDTISPTKIKEHAIETAKPLQHLKCVGACVQPRSSVQVFLGKNVMQ